MSRDISKAIENYKKHFWHDNPHNAGCFTASDITGIVEMSGGEGRKGAAFEAASNGLMAGFWIGYQYGRRQARKRRSAQDYHLDCAVKHLNGSRKKDPAQKVEELKKAAWYIERYIEKAEQK